MMGCLLMGCLLMASLNVCGAFADGQSGPSETQTADWKIITAPPGPVVESSGLANTAGADHFWTHNDSGDEALLYEIDRAGRVVRTVRLIDVDAKDWEDITTFQFGDQEFMIVADVGDNLSNRPHVQLHVLPAPPPGAERVKVWVTVDLQYADGPRDCEAIAADIKEGKIILITKTKFPWCGVYTVQLPTIPDDEPEQTIHTKLIAESIKSLTTPMVTGMDIDRKTGDVLLSSYFQVFHFKADASRQLVQTLSNAPKIIPAPKLKQIEGCCFGIDGSIHLSSEGKRLTMATLTNQ